MFSLLAVMLFIMALGVVCNMLYPSFLGFNKESTPTYETPESLGVIDRNDIKNGIHQPTGLVEGEGLEQVVVSCTPCHSAKLVTQNRATKEGWVGIIRWMQETQNLWDLGANETIIVDYLATHYAPENKGRRDVLSNIEWYNLDVK
ncbi:monoheme cytochrome C [Snuella lapsa]